MRADSIESMAWKVRGSVMRAQEKVKPLTTPSASAATRRLISDRRLQREGGRDCGRHDRHDRDDARRRGERGAGEAVAGGAAAGGARADADREPGPEEQGDLTTESEVRIEPGVAAACIGCAGEQRIGGATDD